MNIKLVVASLACALAFGMAPAHAEDWPEWRGAGRMGVWTETGILERFPDSGLKVRWRTPVRAGYAGPAVAGGRVFVVDAQRSLESMAVVERAVALDEETGAVLWTREWTTDYTGLIFTWAVGPRATPTVDGDRVYVLGAAGILYCLDAETGDVIWRKDYKADYDAELPAWGMAGAPLVDGDLLICLVGGIPAPSWSRSTSAPATRRGGRWRPIPSRATRRRSSSKRAACGSSSSGTPRR